MASPPARALSTGTPLPSKKLYTGMGMPRCSGRPAAPSQPLRPPPAGTFPFSFCQQQLDFWVLMDFPSPGLMVLAGLLMAGSRAILQVRAGTQDWWAKSAYGGVVL